MCCHNRCLPPHRMLGLTAVRPGAVCPSTMPVKWSRELLGVAAWPVRPRRRLHRPFPKAMCTSSFSLLVWSSRSVTFCCMSGSSCLGYSTGLGAGVLMSTGGLAPQVRAAEGARFQASWFHPKRTSPMLSQTSAERVQKINSQSRFKVCGDKFCGVKPSQHACGLGWFRMPI